jgi:16S rRNA (cytosine1402-N4)-methyltransferase
VSQNKHISVLLKPFLDFFEGMKIKVFFDGTLGAGGHSKALLEKHPEIDLLIGSDVDKNALDIAEESLKEWKNKVKFFQGNFSNINDYLKKTGVTCVDGIFLDLGLSSMQIDSEERGFSFRFNSPLDMRMNTCLEFTAKDAVNSLSEKELAFIFKEYGEEPRYKQAARAIIEKRRKKKIQTTQDLIDVLMPVVGKKRGHHPMTLIFQALRIYINDELGNLKEGLTKGIENLCVGGKIGVISFHSLEDRIVKNIFRDSQEVEVLTKKPMCASYEEIRKNRRARSAKMRFAMKVENE